MFALRGVTVSLTFFVLLYCALSALIAVTWRRLTSIQTTERTRAALLFAVRVLPVVASIVITFAFVVPSFQLLEPRSFDVPEGIGALPLGLGLCALLLIAWGSFRVIAAQVKTSRVVARWLEGSHPLAIGLTSRQELDTAAKNVTFCARYDAPPLTLVGVHNPKVLISKSTLALLTPVELQIALKHELAHMRSRDNLKKLIFRLCPSPGMTELENTWSQAAEFAADDAAVSNMDDAIDLAAALVKLSRLVTVDASQVCTVGFVTGSISARVARLLAWNEIDAGKSLLRQIRAWCAIPPIILALFCICATYGPALALTHELTEWLVR